MTRSHAFAVLSAVVLVVTTGCSTAEVPASQQTAVVQPPPASTPSAEPLSEPGSRVPVTCRELLDLPGLTSETIDLSDPYRDITPFGFSGAGALEQAGFLTCWAGGEMGDEPIEFSAIVAVDQESSDMDDEMEWAESVELSTGFAGERSWTNCDAPTLSSYCTTEILADGYRIEYVLVPTSRAPDAPPLDLPAFGASAEALAQQLAAAMTSWGAPAPAWEPPPGSLPGDQLCHDDFVRSAVPFDLAPVDTFGGDGIQLIGAARVEQGAGSCGWWSAEPGRAVIAAEILPGGSWLVDSGRLELPGEQVEQSGLDRATWQADEKGVTVWAVGAQSVLRVTVDMYLGEENSSEAELRVAQDIIAAILVRAGS